MTLTCILVDMENVQLRVPDLSRLERGRHQLKIFHGPSQNKLTIEMVRALQPLGDIRTQPCAPHGGHGERHAAPASQ